MRSASNAGGTPASSKSGPLSGMRHTGTTATMQTGASSKSIQTGPSSRTVQSIPSTRSTSGSAVGLNVTRSRSRVAMPVSRTWLSDTLPRLNPFAHFRDRTWTVDVKFQLPRQVVKRCLEEVNEIDCPQWPGLIKLTLLEAMQQNFDRVMSGGHSPGRDELTTGVFDHLKRHTIVRRGNEVWDDGYVEYEQTSRVFELFFVDLNIFERIFFTVDVSDNRAILAQLFSTLLMVMILLSNAIWALGTLQSNREPVEGCVVTAVEYCEPRPRPFFQAFEAVSVYLFTAELLVRILTVHSVRFQLKDERFIEALLMSFPEPEHLLECERGEAGVEDGSPGAPTDSWNTRRSSITSVSSQFSDFVDGPPEPDGKLLTFVKYVLLPSTIIDLLAVLPYWIGLLSGHPGGGPLVVMRALRLTRIFRIFKFGGMDQIWGIFARLVAASLPAILMMLFFISMLCCMFGTLMWFVERGDWYPEGNPKLGELIPPIVGRGAYLRSTSDLKCWDCFEETPFPSIIHSFWFIIVSITTVGYGAPYVPTTFAGKAVSTIALLLGTIVLAMPIGVVGTNFSHEYKYAMMEMERGERLKVALREIVKAEKLQDDAVAKAASKRVGIEGGIEDSEELQKMAGMELKKVLEARASVLGQAESLVAEWQRSLPESAHEPLCRRLRHTVNQLLADEAAARAAVVGPQKPLVYLSYLTNLDELTKQAHRLIISSVSAEPGSGFGFAQARALRLAWSRFVDECWCYAMEVGEVESEEEAPEFFQMKAALEKLPALPTSDPSRKSLAETLHRAGRKSNAVVHLGRRAQRIRSHAHRNQRKHTGP